LNRQPFNTAQLSVMLLLLLLLMAETCLQLPGDLCSALGPLHLSPIFLQSGCGRLQRSERWLRVQCRVAGLLCLLRMLLGQLTFQYLRFDEPRRADTLAIIKMKERLCRGLRLRFARTE
jgi:hypothetical protein